MATTATDGNSAATIPKPIITCTAIDLPLLTRQAWAALEQTNEPPHLFRLTDAPVRLEPTEVGEGLRAVELNADRLTYHLAEAAEWAHQNKRGELVPCAPPPSIVRNLLAAPAAAQRLPRLRRIVSCPVFTAEGRLHLQPGYCAETGIFFEPAPGLEISGVPVHPTDDQIALARQLLIEELLFNFPFVADADRAHAVALAVQPFARELIHGPTPLYVVDKPTPGSGATLMIELILGIAHGHDIDLQTAPTRDEEWRKFLAANMRAAAPYVAFDNQHATIASGALASAITSGRLADRIVGATERGSWRVSNSWVATGNNVSLSWEMVRRAVVSRIDPREEFPEQRTGFRHPDIRAWARHHRGPLVWACLVLVAAWVARERPAGTQTLGMFEGWAQTIGGILDVAGVPGLLANRERVRAAAASDEGGLRQFLTSWFHEQCLGYRPTMHAAHLIAIANSVPGLLTAGDGRGRETQLGRMLSQNVDRIFTVAAGSDTARVVIRRGHNRASNVSEWRLEPLDQHP